MNILKQYKKPLIILALAILCIAGVWRYMEYHRMQNPNRTHPPMEITANPRTFCIGRTLIDLPQGLYPDDPAIASLIQSSATLDGVRIEARPNVALEEFNAIVASRWAEAQAYTHNANRNPYVKPSQRQQVKENGWILAFNHREIRSNVREENGVLVHDKRIYYDAEGYLWDKGTMFTMKDSGVRVSEKITDLIQRSRFHNVAETPTEAGVCFNGGFIQTYCSNRAEDYSWQLELPAFSLLLKMGTDIRETPLLERNAQRISPTHSSSDDYTTHKGMTQRAAQRPDDALPAEEIVWTTTTYNNHDHPKKYTSGVLALWEFNGRPKPDPKPYVVAEYRMAYESTERPNNLGDYPNQTANSTYPSKEEFFALWDAIMSTIRFYPGALTPAPEQQKPEPPPMPSARQIQQDQRALDDFLRNG